MDYKPRVLRYSSSQVFEPIGNVGIEGNEHIGIVLPHPRGKGVLTSFDPIVRQVKNGHSVTFRETLLKVEQPPAVSELRTIYNPTGDGYPNAPIPERTQLLGRCLDPQGHVSGAHVKGGFAHRITKSDRSKRGIVDFGTEKAVALRGDDHGFDSTSLEDRLQFPWSQSIPAQPELLDLVTVASRPNGLQRHVLLGRPE